tara:strand:+ start:328 stop:555 length:228 start_codon:yes stop_codon:yes gene_type:complete
MKPVKILGANQLSIETESKIVFQSYDTIVCEITNFENGNKPVIKITENQPQSKTTAKYLNKFLQLHTSFNNYKNI